MSDTLSLAELHKFRAQKKLERDNTASSKTQSIRIQRYRKFLLDEKHTDVTFLVGTKKVPVKANKTILRFGSDVFSRMFDFSKLGESIYKIPDLEPNEFKKFLEVSFEQFIYTGEVINDFLDPAIIMRVATSYGVDDVVEHCMKNLVKSLNVENCASTLKLAIELEHSNLEKSTIAFVCKSENSRTIFKSISKDFTEETLLKLLPRDELAINEVDLFEAVVNWGKLQIQTRNPKYLRSVLEPLIKHIRFPIMKPSDFSTKVAPTELLTVEETMAVLLFFNVDLNQRDTFKSNIFNCKPRHIIEPKSELSKNVRRIVVRKVH